MARHAHTTGSPSRGIRLGTVGVIWLAGLAAGFSALLTAAAKYGCAAEQHGFGCRTSGSVFGILLVVAILAIVIAVTLLVLGRPETPVLITGAAGFVGLAACFTAARLVLATT